MIHTDKGFGIVNKAEIDVFLELSCFFPDPADVGNLIRGSSAFSKTSLYFFQPSVSHDVLCKAEPEERLVCDWSLLGSDPLEWSWKWGKSNGERGKNQSVLYQADQHSADLGNGLRDLLRNSGTH